MLNLYKRCRSSMHRNTSRKKGIQLVALWADPAVINNNFQVSINAGVKVGFIDPGSCLYRGNTPHD
jgi:hypothetical protein